MQDCLLHLLSHVDSRCTVRATGYRKPVCVWGGVRVLGLYSSCSVDERKRKKTLPLTSPQKGNTIPICLSHKIAVSTDIKYFKCVIRIATMSANYFIVILLGI
jgi:hypothetical protein